MGVYLLRRSQSLFAWLALTRLYWVLVAQAAEALITGSVPARPVHPLGLDSGVFQAEDLMHP